VGRSSEEAGRPLENSKSYDGNGFPRAGGTVAKGCGADDESHDLEPLPKRVARLCSSGVREDVQTLLANQAKNYSSSTLRSIRVVLSLTLGWARDCGWLENNPCTRIRLPQQTGGRKVTRTVLTSEQVTAIAGKLEEPYATLVLSLAASGMRIGEAIAIKWSDFEGNVLRVSRRICEGNMDSVKTESSIRRLPVEELPPSNRPAGSADAEHSKSNGYYDHSVHNCIIWSICYAACPISA